MDLVKDLDVTVTNTFKIPFYRWLAANRVWRILLQLHRGLKIVIPEIL